MKKILCFFFSIQLFAGIKLNAQIQMINAAKNSDPKKDFIEQQSYLSKNSLKDYTSFYGDSLMGFNEAAVKTQLLNRGFHGAEYLGCMKHLKREFINKKYNLVPQQPEIISTPSNAKIIGGANTINVIPCVNEGFELSLPGAYTNANSVAGWTVSSRMADGQCSPANWIAGSSEFSLVSTPISNFGVIGTIPHSPFGGTVVAQLNNITPNYNTTKLSQTFPVTAANAFFQYAYAGFWQDGNSGHGCCDQSLFKLLVKDCSGNLLSCLTVSLNPYTSGCTTGLTSYTTTIAADSWTNWQVRSVDLTPFIGTCITIEAISSDCSGGAHYGVTFFDAQCSSQFAPVVNSAFGTSLGAAVNMCQGSSYASIQAPLGYATYSWVPPIGHPPLTAAQSTLSALTLTNASPNTTYTLYLSSYAGCFFSAVYSLSLTSVGISAIGSTPTCSLGTSGSATVIANGSGAGYNYYWTNAANFVVGTSSVVTNLSPGVYNIAISAIGSSGCGSASGTVSVGSAPASISYVTKPICGTEAYFTASSGSNFHWYNGFTNTTPTLVSTSSSYTASPISANYYWGSYTTNQGCKDSTQYTLSSSVPGGISAANTLLGCNSGSGGGIGVITMTPSNAAPTGLNYYVVLSAGATPNYSSGINPSSSNTFTALNLSANGTYNVNAFDGICKYSTSFTVGSFPAFNFTLTPTVSQTLCASSPVLANVVFSSTALSSQYTYSWSPNIFLFANNPSLQQTIITPTAAPGTYSTIIYTVAVTSTTLNCPQTQTLAITITNLLPPVINTIPQLCTYSPVFTISASPSGGVYSNNTAVTVSGLISPSTAAIGVNTFTYAISVGTCVAKKSGSFNVGSPPTLTISGNSSFCEGQSTTLLAGGATNYTWSNSTNAPFITVSPISNTTYSVTGFSAVTSCTNTTNITVTVMPLPNITITGDSAICAGESTTLVAGGSNSYLWNTGSASQTISVSPGITSSYTVQGANSLGTCFGTKTVTIYVTNCTDTGIEEWRAAGGLNIYPNPTNNKLTIETKNDIQISLHNQLGQLLLEETIQKGNYNLDLSNYASGIYLLKADYKGEIKIIKLIKTN